MLCQISKDLLIQQSDCWANYHIVIITVPKMGMCWFNTRDKLLINKPFVGPTNSFFTVYFTSLLLIRLFFTLEV